MSIKVKDLKSIDFYKVKGKTSKKIEKVVFPNNVEVGANSDLPASLIVYGEIVAESGFSGSLTTLSDGTPYLTTDDAGIVIQSGSNGSIGLSTVISLYTGSATPEGAIIASIGDIYSKNTSTGELWIKETGVATNTGWAVIGGSSGPEEFVHNYTSDGVSFETILDLGVIPINDSWTIESSISSAGITGGGIVYASILQLRGTAYRNTSATSTTSGFLASGNLPGDTCQVVRVSNNVLLQFRTSHAGDIQLTYRITVTKKSL